jgi:hypothetical protein
VILELGDGRELHLPDEMEDESARQLKTFILAGEQRAKDAEARMMAHHAEVVALRNEMGNIGQLRESVNALRAEMKQGLQGVVAAAHADRVIVYDDKGDPVRSRIAK